MSADSKPDATIAVWTTETPERSALPTLTKRAVGHVAEVSSEQLSANIKSFVQKFSSAFDAGIDTDLFTLDEIELTLAVSATGGVELVGKMDVAAQGSIKVKLKRKSRE